jgi:hypothetical protein
MHDLLHAPGNHLNLGRLHHCESSRSFRFATQFPFSCFCHFVFAYIFKIQKISVVLLPKKIMGDQTTKLCDFTNAPNAQFIASPITSPEIKADSFEVSPRLLNLIAKDQFGGSASEDASMHLLYFCEISDMQKFKNVENDIVKLKLFPFSLKGEAKDWLLSLLMVA